MLSVTCLFVGCGTPDGQWVSEGLLDAGISNAIRGLVPALFSIAMHREDFPPGSYQPTVKLISEALALRTAT